MRILGVKIDNLEKDEILRRTRIFLEMNEFHQIATINPEFLLKAQKNARFRDILNDCDLNVADGIGIKFALWKLKSQKLKCRMTGADLMLEILKIADEKKLKVFLAASQNGLSTWEETAEAIGKIYPRLKINGANIVSPTTRNKMAKSLQNNNHTVSDEIAALSSAAYNDIVFCNFGAPLQEEFLHSLKKKNCGNIKLAMGVGGSFDFLTKKLRRAPMWIREIGLEWLFRLIQQPNRIRRILRAVIVFPIKIIIKDEKYEA